MYCLLVLKQMRPTAVRKMSPLYFSLNVFATRVFRTGLKLMAVAITLNLVWTVCENCQITFVSRTRWVFHKSLNSQKLRSTVMNLERLFQWSTVPLMLFVSSRAGRKTLDDIFPLPNEIHKEISCEQGILLCNAGNNLATRRKWKSKTSKRTWSYGPFGLVRL